MKERINNFIYNLPWWWVLIPILLVLGPILVMSFNNAGLGNPKTSTVWLKPSQVLVVTNKPTAYEFTLNELEPKGCSTINHTKNETNADVFWVKCQKFESYIRFTCTVTCVVESEYNMEIKDQ
jgi:hypothetical protein